MTEWLVARQCNDGDCLCSSLAVIASVNGCGDYLLQSPILIGIASLQPPWQLVFRDASRVHKEKRNDGLGRYD